MPNLPDPIQAALDAFAAQRKTGQITLNLLNGAVVSADVREHIKGKDSTPSKNVLDNVNRPCNISD